MGEVIIAITRTKIISKIIIATIKERQKIHKEGEEVGVLFEKCNLG